MAETENLTQLKEKLYQMENHMRTLEWDYNREQINPFKKQQFEAMLKEKEELISKINTLERSSSDRKTDLEGLPKANLEERQKPFDKMRGTSKPFDNTNE